MIYHTSAHVFALYIPNMENSLLSEYTSSYKKENGKKRECTAFARVSVKFKAIFRAHRFLLIVIDHHWWTLNDGSDRSLVDSVYGK